MITVICQYLKGRQIYWPIILDLALLASIILTGDRALLAIAATLIVLSVVLELVFRQLELVDDGQLTAKNLVNYEERFQLDPSLPLQF